jgi:hypothetical protein
VAPRLPAADPARASAAPGSPDTRARADSARSASPDLEISRAAAPSLLASGRARESGAAPELASCAGEPERCDGRDNDCDAAIDELDALGCSTAYLDEDADGFGALADGCFCALPAARVANALDCDDTRADVHPGSPEVCDGQVDNDCDGATDLCGARPHQALLPGDLAIRAVHEQVSGLEDPEAERFEIENRTPDRLELMGLEIRDDGVDGFRVRRSLVLEPGGRVLLGRNGDAATNGGMKLDYVYSDFILSNAGDAIELRSDGVIIDRSAYLAPPSP